MTSNEHPEFSGSTMQLHFTTGPTERGPYDYKGENIYSGITEFFKAAFKNKNIERPTLVIGIDRDFTFTLKEGIVHSNATIERFTNLEEQIMAIVNHMLSMHYVHHNHGPLNDSPSSRRHRLASQSVERYLKRMLHSYYIHAGTATDRYAIERKETVYFKVVYTPFGLTINWATPYVTGAGLDNIFI